MAQVSCCSLACCGPGVPRCLAQQMRQRTPLHRQLPGQQLRSAAVAAKQRQHIQRVCSRQQTGRTDQAPANSAADALAALQRRCAAAVAAAALALAQLAAPIAVPPPAAAVLNSPNAQIARAPDVALRRAIPPNNAYVRDVQKRLEGIQFKLRIPQRKPWSAIAEDASTAAITMAQVDKVLEGTPGGREEDGRALIADVQEGLRRLQAVVDMQNPDKVSFRVADVLRDVAKLEILQAPGLPFIIPREYAENPHLTGRAEVELTIEKEDGSLAYVTNEGGGPQREAHLTLTVDGYSAPLTAGNFVRNVLEGLYTGAQLKVDQGAVLAGGDVSSGGRTLPLEQLPIGQFDIVYRSPLDVRSGELPVLPLSIYGALAMSHGPDDGTSDATEFFIYKFDKQSSGLAGLSFDEGEFGVFGYVTNGAELIPQLGAGDRIVAARLLSGGDRLVNAPASIAERAMKASVMYGM